ncbi:MAG: 50S ribosomal protein L24 [Saprospiraceae bacterium]|nr:50S ribosomal protein L24 [Saprospiraceae bacterium]MBP7699703.1 50S ribosomal protein L24 [Saprospiraceae bacterium]
MATNKNKTTRFAPKLRIKKGDKVIVIAGSSKGQSGEVAQVFPRENRAIVEGVNLVTKHRKPVSETQQGGIEQIAAPLHISNLMLLDAKNQPTRVGRKEVDGKVVRYSKKSGEIIK